MGESRSRKGIFAQERRRIDLRADDMVILKGTIKGHFEVHFGVLIPETEITLEFCDDFDSMITRFIAENGLARNETSDELDEIFNKNFKTTPSEDALEEKHVTQELWESWCDKFKQIVEKLALPIIAKRERLRRTRDNNGK